MHRTNTIGEYRRATWLCTCGARGKASTYGAAQAAAKKHEQTAR